MCKASSRVNIPELGTDRSRMTIAEPDGMSEKPHIIFEPGYVFT